MKLKALIKEWLVTTLILSIAFPVGVFAQDVQADIPEQPQVSTETDYSSFNDNDAQVVRIEEQVMKDLGCSLRKKPITGPAASSATETPPAAPNAEGQQPSADSVGFQNYQATVNQERLALLAERISKLEPAVYSRVLIRLAKCYVDKPGSRSGVESVFNGVYGNVQSELEIEHLEDVLIKDTKTLFWVAAAFVTFLIVKRGANAARTAMNSGEAGFGAFSRNFGRAFVRGLRPGITPSQNANVAQQLKNTKVAVSELMTAEMAAMNAEREMLEKAMENALAAETATAKVAAEAAEGTATGLWGRVRSFWKNFKFSSVFSGGMNRSLRYWEGTLDGWRLQATEAAQQVAKRYADEAMVYAKEIAEAKAAARPAHATLPEVPLFGDLQKAVPTPTPTVPKAGAPWGLYVRNAADEAVSSAEIALRTERAMARVRGGEALTPEKVFKQLASEGTELTRENLEKAVFDHLKKNIDGMSVYSLEGKALLERQLDELTWRLENAGNARLSGSEGEVRDWLRSNNLLPDEAAEAAVKAGPSAARQFFANHVTANRVALAGLGAFYGHHVYTLMTKRRVDPRPILAGAKIGVVNSAALTSDLVGNFADELYRVLGTRNPEGTADELKAQVLAITREPQFELLRSHGHLSALPEGLENKTITEIASTLEGYFKENLDRIETELKSVSDVTALQPAGDSVTRKELEKDQEGSELLWGLSAPPSVTLARLGAVRLTLEEVNRLLEEIQTFVPSTGEKK